MDVSSKLQLKPGQSVAVLNPPPGLVLPEAAAAMRRVRREDFVPPAWRDYAYAEVPLPLPGRLATISCPHSYPLFYQALGLDQGRAARVGSHVMVLAARNIFQFAWDLAKATGQSTDLVRGWRPSYRGSAGRASSRSGRCPAGSPRARCSLTARARCGPQRLSGWHPEGCGYRSLRAIRVR